jgi:H+/Cl- antiporter ClcA
MQDRKSLIAVIGVILLFLLCTVGSWFMVRQDLADDVRDFLLILLAIESMIIGGFLLLMLWHLYQLIRLLREEVIPLLNTTKETVEHVKHTTTFVGQSVAAPIISVSGMVAGVREMVTTLRGKKEPIELLRRDDDG